MVGVKLTDNEKMQIAYLYSQGLKCQEIGDMFDVTKTKISQVAKEYGLSRQQKVLTYSKEEVRIMYDLYLKGENVEYISQIYRINRASVYNLFQKYNFDLVEDRHRAYTVNDVYFNKIDTANKAYILGFLWADGHNNVDKGIVEMRLQERDKHILEDISVEMENDRPLYYVEEKRATRQNTYRMYITSRQISNALLQYGMYANKTYVLQWPFNMDDQFIPHFLRGFTDGDGYVGDFQISWVGTEMMMQKIQAILLDALNVNVTIRDTKTDIIKTMQLHRKKEVVRVLDWIYKDADLKLNRKFLKYQEMINKDARD